MIQLPGAKSSPSSALTLAVGLFTVSDDDGISAMEQQLLTMQANLEAMKQSKKAEKERQRAAERAAARPPKPAKKPSVDGGRRASGGGGGGGAMSNKRKPTGPKKKKAKRDDFSSDDDFYDDGGGEYIGAPVVQEPESVTFEMKRELAVKIVSFEGENLERAIDIIRQGRPDLLSVSFSLFLVLFPAPRLTVRYLYYRTSTRRLSSTLINSTNGLSSPCTASFVPQPTPVASPKPRVVPTVLAALTKLVPRSARTSMRSRSRRGSRCSRQGLGSLIKALSSRWLPREEERGGIVLVLRCRRIRLARILPVRKRVDRRVMMIRREEARSRWWLIVSSCVPGSWEVILSLPIPIPPLFLSPSESLLYLPILPLLCSPFCFSPLPTLLISLCSLSLLSTLLASSSTKIDTRNTKTEVCLTLGAFARSDNE